MDINLEADFERCCRLCAEEQEVTIMLFSEEAEAMLLRNKLNKYLLIEVDEDDKLPKNICIQCCTKLQTVCEFIDSAHKAQESLHNLSMILDQMKFEKKMPSKENIIENIKIKSDPYDDHGLIDSNHMITEMEVSVDPMMVLQNSEGPLSPNPDGSLDGNSEDVTYLHGVDGENVTIKLIRRGEKTTDDESTNSNMKPFPCMICRRSFFTELALKNHIWVHNAEEKSTKQFNCSICNDSFEYKSDLVTHLKQHKTQGMCQMCGRVFRSEKNLAAHLAVHLSKGKSYNCKVCGRSYDTRSNLKTHSITHSTERPYHCHLCKKSFKRNQDLKFHINQHTGAKPYKCPFCEKCFASSGNCYSHRNRMHPDRSGESKLRRRLVKRENQAVHTMLPKLPVVSVKGVMKYQCQLCDHSFVKRDNFTYHMYQHTGEKPFQCSFCTEKFVTRRGLLLHHDKVHPTQDRPLALLSKNALLK